MSAARASLLAALVAAAANGQGAYMLTTFYNNTNCTGPGGVPFVVPYTKVQDFEPAVGEALEGGCGYLVNQSTSVTVVDCVMRFYAGPGCGAGGEDPINEMHLDGAGEPKCLGKEGTSELAQCVSSIPPGAIDTTDCVAKVPDMENVTAVCESCIGQEPPYTCEEGLMLEGACSGYCTSYELDQLVVFLKMAFGCSCDPRSDMGPTCGDVRAAYSASQCCGNPGRPFEWAAKRRLAGGPAPRARKAKHARRAGLSGWPSLARPRGLSSAIAARIDAGVRGAGEADTTEHALRAMREILEGVKLRRGAAAARSLAAKAKKALMEV